MDIYCPKCAEPWEVDSLHDTPDGLPFDEARQRFYREGCGVFGVACEAEPSLRSQAASALYDLLGDDVDGAAAMLDDFEYVGWLDE